MKSCAIFGISAAFLFVLMQQWSQVSAGERGEKDGYGCKNCLDYDNCCYYAQEYYYKCVASEDCGRGDPYYCNDYYDTCSGTMKFNAPTGCKVCLNDYYILSDGAGCACCSATGYCDSFEYTPPNHYKEMHH